jgi:hypothetical protein
MAKCPHSGDGFGPGGRAPLASPASDSAPKLRSDVVFQRRETDGAVSYVARGSAGR